MKHRIHLISGSLALMTILTFWLSTTLLELFGTTDQVIWIKTAIPWGLLVLIPALAATGGSGMALGKTRSDPIIVAKKRRMQVIAAVGLLVLVPSAFFLAWKAGRGEFDVAFYVVQGLELAAGALNLALLSLNFRNGLIASGRIGARKPA